MFVKGSTSKLMMLAMFLVASSSSVQAFTTTPKNRQVRSKHHVSASSTALTKCHMSVSNNNEEYATTTRRAWVTKIAKATTIAAAISTFNAPSPSFAAVYVDPDVYGDKELKVATVNRLRQNIRDVIVQDPKLAPLFLKIALQDALTYNAETEMGGPDGSIVSVILSADAPKALAGLKPAAVKLVEVLNKVKRTTAVTMADLVTFAGAEAIESAGGPRVVVQLGKLDAKGLKDQTPKELQYVDLCGDKNGKDIVNAFVASGLNQRDLTLIYGAIASMEKVVDDMRPEKEEEEEEENEMGDKEIFIPSSFGSRKEIYGKRLGSMNGSAVLASVASDLKKKRQPISDVFNDEKVGEWVTYYGSKDKAFMKDLPDAYRRAMSLGRRYTGGKIESLLGGAEDEL